MNNLYLKLILSTFCKQNQLNDCGPACLRSIFRYSGIYGDITPDKPENMVSLFDLQLMAAESGITGRCVKMDVETLRETQTPCILHVLKDGSRPHFIVHYFFDSETNLHLIGDPDDNLSCLSAFELEQQWQSKAALYFENITPSFNWNTRFFPWKYLVGFKFIPAALWFAVPLLSVIAGFLGLALTVVVEKAIQPDFLQGRGGFLVVVLILLTLLSLARCFINYFRQLLIIRFGQKLDKWLFLNLIRKRFSNSTSQVVPANYRSVPSDVQRIHQSAASLIGGFLSDALTVLTLLLCLYLYAPILIAPELLVLLVMFWLVDRNIPFMMISQQQPFIGGGIHLSQSVNAVELNNILFAKSRDQNKTLSLKASKLSRNINKMNLLFELLSAVNIIFVLIYGLTKLKDLAISYEHFIFSVIACYAITILAAKMCNQLLPIAQGAAMVANDK